MGVKLEIYVRPHGLDKGRVGLNRDGVPAARQVIAAWYPVTTKSAVFSTGRPALLINPLNRLAANLNPLGALNGDGEKIFALMALNNGPGEGSRAFTRVRGESIYSNLTLY